MGQELKWSLITNVRVLKFLVTRPGEMGQWVATLTALPEDPDSISSTCIVADNNSNSRARGV